jgi:hypothetical protein
MRPKLFDILSNKEVPIDNEQLAKYLGGDLDDAARHEVEQALTSGNNLEQDAWEGWQQTEDKKKMLQAAEEINKRLSRQLQSPVIHKRKKPITQLSLVWWVTGFILVLVLMAWLVIFLLG